MTEASCIDEARVFVDKTQMKSVDTKKALLDARPLVAGGGLEPPTSGL